MDKTVERMLYLTLLLVFVCLGIAIYIAVNFGHKLDQQGEQGRKQIIATQEAQGKILNDIQRQHDKQDAELRCIATLFTTHKQVTAVDFNTCAIQSALNSPAQVGTSQKASPSQNTKTNNNAVTSATPNNKPAASPTPAPQPANPVNTILNTLQKTLGLTP